MKSLFENQVLVLLLIPVISSVVFNVILDPLLTFYFFRQREKKIGVWEWYTSIDHKAYLSSYVPNSAFNLLFHTGSYASFSLIFIIIFAFAIMWPFVKDMWQLIFAIKVVIFISYACRILFITMIAKKELKKY